MLEAHDYYPFGLDMPGRSSAGLPMRQGFTGYWRDREGGLDLYYSGARMYSPGTGRFFGVDPLAVEFPTWSPYAYTFNNPVNWRDPDGRSACCGTLQGSLRFAMNQDRMYLGTLSRADSRGQLNSQLRTDAINLGVAVLDRGINTADAVSTGAEGVAFASSFVKSPQGLAVTGVAMATSFSADVAGVGMSFMKEKLQNSNHSDSRNRIGQVAVGELMTRVGGQRFGARFGPLIGPAFQIITSNNTEQGQNSDRPVAPVDNTGTVRRVGDANEN